MAVEVRGRGLRSGRTEAKVEAPILWPSDVKGSLTGKKDSEGRKD